ncbi:IclR family transcriptional regulator [Noviherbaspirillum saxi]|nr:IclR family transcriptional regulator [Noviherbaspirillum saxi]
MSKAFQNGVATDAASMNQGDDARALRVLRLIEHLANATQPLTLSQLSTRLDVPKATMMRMLDHLQRHGYVLRTPFEGGGYVPGTAATRLALSALRNNALIRVSRATLGKLVAATGETCNLVVPEGNNVIYVDRVETEEPLRLQLPPGTRAPMHCTASGKLFLSRLSLFEQRSLLTAMPLKKLTPRTITDPASLEAELARIAKCGIGFDHEEFVLGMVAVAVPIQASDGKVVAAVACHAPVARKSIDDLLAYVGLLTDAASVLQPLLAGGQIAEETPPISSG